MSFGRSFSWRSMLVMTSIFVAVSSLTFSGCSGQLDLSTTGAGTGGTGLEEGPDLDVGQGTGNPINDTFATIGAVYGTSFQAIGQALAGGGALKLVTIADETVACTPSGQAVINGEADSAANPATYDIDVDLQDCNGVNGTINISGEFGTGSYTFSIDGLAGANGCSVDFSAFGFNVSASGASFTVSLDGSITADCGGASVTCDFSGFDLLTGASTVTTVCSCSGSGC